MPKKLPGEKLQIADSGTLCKLFETTTGCGTAAPVPMVEPAPGLPRSGIAHRPAPNAMGFVILAPFRPFEIVLVDGRQLRRAEGGRGQAVLQPGPDRHDAVAAGDAVAEHVADEGLGEELEADLAPAVADQLQHVGFLRHLAGGVDDDGG